ncbi:hypothetical protein WN944_029540 [Citrus x changshan-huyou]|uniref:Uncharacterized protein n=1 Tax=Citrus x changshan-huyou TaxID=2935761 RepID=A0AAP0LLG3_9ROSI
MDLIYSNDCLFLSLCLLYCFSIFIFIFKLTLYYYIFSLVTRKKQRSFNTYPRHCLL